MKEITKILLKFILGITLAAVTVSIWLYFITDLNGAIFRSDPEKVIKIIVIAVVTLILAEFFWVFARNISNSLIKPNRANLNLVYVVNKPSEITSQDIKKLRDLEKAGVITGYEGTSVYDAFIICECESAFESLQTTGDIPDNLNPLIAERTKDWAQNELFDGCFIDNECVRETTLRCYKEALLEVDEDAVEE